MPRTLVTFHAHPDDESMLTAGVMAKAAAEGCRVVLVVATMGEVGQVDQAFLADDEDLGARRAAELDESASILGVARVVALGYRDSGSGDDPPPPGSFVAADLDEAAGRLAAVLREEAADVLTVYDPNGGYGHRDHRRVHAVGYRAAELAGTPVVLEATINRDLMRIGLDLAASLGFELPEDFAPPDVSSWYTPADEITHAVDVGAHLAAKRASMAAHASQATSATGDASTRSLSMFLSLPDEHFTLAFGTEWFVDRRCPAGGELRTDVFAGIASPGDGEG